ncbi:2-succinyl-6-hydroxy-2,4-cyclohexadiene-1-carboxylate synthase [Shewanella colwelliana]|uniref:2-succinyl-6-hydroxy-2, 4-cyclohexadiene-1-carboxylate synthase n=1 Tax=Shewanella colwelliana TaxID=23 RepID=UPI0021805EA9|nr:2-succinyl-6-hydroxy-2,4-cyclohexadiene-1-carboxylate synthase [Shewanella colwelliana]
MDKAKLMLAVRCYGDSNQPNLVLLHGFLGDKADWHDLMPRLSRHFHCVCIDLPGHGASPHIELVSPGFEQVAQLIQQTLAGIHIDKFHLLGYSLGGRIALHLAKLFPAQLLSVTLESCHPGLTIEAEKHARLQSDKKWHQLLTTCPISTFLARWYQQGVFADLSKVARSRLIERRQHNNPAALGAIYLATSLGLQQDLSIIPNQSAIKWHYFVGKDDSKFSSLAQAWQQQASITLNYFDNVGHNVHLANGQAFCERLIQQLIQDTQ